MFCGDVMRTIRYAALISTALFAAGSSSRADTITMFNVSGTAMNQSFVPVGSCDARANCPFSGTLDVDVTNGTIPAIDITFPSLDPFNRVVFTEPSGTGSTLVAATNAESLGQNLNLTFTGSLMGFTGGTITGENVTTSDGGIALFVINAGGSITAVPEPSTWAMMLLGFAGLGYAGYRGSRRTAGTA